MVQKRYMTTSAKKEQGILVWIWTIQLLSLLHNIESWIWSFHWGALLSLGQHISWTAPHALFDQTPCNHASFEPDPLLYTSWCGVPFWGGRILQNRYFWRKPGLVWIEKYRLVEFVGNPLKISPISCGTPPHRTNLKTEFTLLYIIVFWICYFSRNTTKGFPY